MKSNRIIKSISVIIFSFFFLVMNAQGLEVKGMKTVLSDLSASINQRNDSLGIPCGLVKVQVSASDISFGKNVVGNIDSNLNEYWVYLSKGSKDLTIKRPCYLPFKIVFKDYGIDEIESKTSYLLILRESSFKPDKNTVILNIKPFEAQVVVDNIPLDILSNGSYRLFLKKGEHVLQVKADGYQSAVEIVNTGKGIQTVNVALESLKAQVQIGCKTNGAQLYLNDKKIGNGNWQGSVVPGTYVIKAQKDGFLSLQQEVIIVEKGNHLFELPELKQMRGRLRIITNISDYNNVLLDGKEVKLDDGLLIDVSLGKHTLTLSQYGYGSVELPVNIKGIDEDTIQYTLMPLNGYERAVQGDGKSQFWLAHGMMYRDYIQAAYWFSLAIDNLEDDGSENLKTTALQLLASLYGEKDKPEVYNFQKSKDIYLKLINYKLSDKGQVLNAYKHIGDLYKKESMYADAIVWYKKCMKYVDEDSSLDFCIDLGDCYLKTGNKESAREWYQRALNSRFESVCRQAKVRLM
ncbi:MAG: hypothetical protein IKZ62_00930 [Prevotella sp.]|nr:hypothetical protein [Prevotella sp.]